MVGAKQVTALLRPYGTITDTAGPSVGAWQPVPLPYPRIVDQPCRVQGIDPPLYLQPSSVLTR